MQLGLQKKIAIVTGGARGIGEAISRELAREGSVVWIFDRDGAAAGAVVQAIKSKGGEAAAWGCDLTHEAEVANGVAAVLAQHGRIDIVVNNAADNDGVGLAASAEAFRASLEKSLVHCFVLVKACREALSASRGSVINIGSKCASTGQGNTSGYVAAKGALHALTREWALDFAPAGVRVNCVVPAEVMTPMYAHWLGQRPDPQEALARICRLIPLEQRMTTTGEIAATVVFLASERSAHTTGQIIFVDGGYTHLDRAYPPR